MASVVNLVLVGVVLTVHTFLAAVLTRFFRDRLSTTLGSAVYVVLLVPFVLAVTTLLFGQLVVADFGPVLLLGLWVGLPAALGVTIDVLYMPPPDEVDLPETAD